MLSGEGKIYVSDKKFENVHNYEGSDLQIAAISNEGIVFGTSDRGVFYVNFDDFSENWIADSLFDYIASDNGNSILFQDNYGDVFVYTLGKSEPVKLIETEYIAHLEGVSNDGELGFFGIFSDYDNKILDYYYFEGEDISCVGTGSNSIIGTCFSDDQKIMLTRTRDFMLYVKKSNEGDGAFYIFPGQEKYKKGDYEFASRYELYGSNNRIRLSNCDTSEIYFGIEKIIKSEEDNLLNEYGYAVEEDGVYVSFSGLADVVEGHTYNGESRTVVKDVKDYCMIWNDSRYYMYYIDKDSDLYVTYQPVAGDPKLGEENTLIDSNVDSLICPREGDCLFYTKVTNDGATLFVFDMGEKRSKEIYNTLPPRLTGIDKLVNATVDGKVVYYLDDAQSVPGNKFKYIGDLYRYDCKTGRTNMISHNVVLGSVTSGVRWTGTGYQMLGDEDVYSDSINYSVYSSTVNSNSEEESPQISVDVYHYNGLYSNCIMKDAIY